MNVSTVMRGELTQQVLKEIRSGYTQDGFCSNLQSVSPLRPGCEERDGLLFIENQLDIPKVENLQTDFIAQAHKLAGHMRFTKTYHHLKDHFFWPGMARQTKDWDQRCDTCQRTKDSTKAVQGKMQTQDIPDKPLEDIALDFIGPLPKQQQYDMILSVTCRLSGYTRAIPTCQGDSAEKIAQRFLSAWVSVFGAPRSMTGDRDKIWTSKFWKELTRLLGMEL